MRVWSHLFGRWVFLCAIFVHLQFSSWGKWPRNLHKHMDSEMTASHCCRCTSWQCCSGCCRCAALQTSRRNLCCSTPLRSTTRSGAPARTRRWGTRTNTVSRGYLVWPNTWSNWNLDTSYQRSWELRPPTDAMLCLQSSTWRRRLASLLTRLPPSPSGWKVLPSPDTGIVENWRLMGRARR